MNKILYITIFGIFALANSVQAMDGLDDGQKQELSKKGVVETERGIFFGVQEIPESVSLSPDTGGIYQDADFIPENNHSLQGSVVHNGGSKIYIDPLD